jgi:predicted component of type VI protein secretion system
VRANGLTNRGETLRIADGINRVGSGPACSIRLAGDAAVAAQHAEISSEEGEFSIRPLGAVITVEGKPIDQRHVLTDGETVGIGRALFVFKCAIAGNIGAKPDGRARPRREIKK